MNNADQWIIWAGLINAVLILAVVLMIRDWPTRKPAKKSR